MAPERIERELARLHDGGQLVEYVSEPRELVLYRSVPTAGAGRGLPGTTDVVVPVPPGYPAAMIDLAGLPADSPLLAHVKGGQNNQGSIVGLDGRNWQLASYHPHNGGGGGPWNQNKHGFHTYLDHLIAWLDRLG